MSREHVGLSRLMANAIAASMQDCVHQTLGSSGKMLTTRLQEDVCVKVGAAYNAATRTDRQAADSGLCVGLSGVQRRVWLAGYNLSLTRGRTP